MHFTSPEIQNFKTEDIIKDISAIDYFTAKFKHTLPVFEVTYLDYQAEESKPDGNGIMSLSLGPFKRVFNMSTFNECGSYERGSEKDLKERFDIDVNGEVVSSIKYKLGKNITDNILSKIHSAGDQTHLSEYSNFDEFVYFKLYPLLNKIPFINLPNRKQTKVSQHKLHNYLLQESGEIHKATLRGGGNYIIGGFETIKYIEDIPAFVHCVDEQKPSDRVIEVGELGRIKVYLDMSITDNSVIVGRKEEKITEGGMFFAYMEEGNIRELELVSEKTFRPLIKLCFAIRCCIDDSSRNNKRYRKSYLKIR
jgi:hypothetical protein